MSANMSWGEPSAWVNYLNAGIMSPNAVREWLGLRPLCARCDRYVSHATHRRLHARGKKPRCRS